jgi:phosphatidylserine decarboxylase
MAEPIRYIDRASGTLETEAVYGAGALSFFYGPGAPGAVFLPMLSKLPVWSAAYGFMMSRGWSAGKVRPFIAEYGIKIDEFVEPEGGYASFNDFFYRKLQPNARPISEQDAVMPADARYLAFPRVDEAEGFHVKGEKFTLSSLLQDDELAARYEKGAMVLARLCPVDYHRFHFPAAGQASAPRLINGWLYSVNPVALKSNARLLAENKRVLVTLDTERLGKIAYLAVGATMVGSITETYSPGPVTKGGERGFFAFGASALVLLFEPGKISLDGDLIAATAQGRELLALMGQSMGRAG